MSPAGTRATFLLSKDPLTQSEGDIALSKVMMRLARESGFDVTAIALSREPGPSPEPWLTRVPKPSVRLSRIALDSLRRRRSLVHTRFDVPAFTAAIERHDSDVWIAEHSYVAEPFLASARRGEPFVLNTVNTESEVWRATRGTLARTIEAPRILRDEVRVARAADAVGTYDEQEAEFYRREGVPGARWINLTLEPVAPTDRALTPPRLVFLGTRDWPPNQEAFEVALRRWPAISAGIAGAELVVVGAPKPGAPAPALPPGVRDVGFVDDLGRLLDTCRGMVAPVLTGGGVRVKILEAASRGLPVVGTSAAVGSLGGVLDLAAYDDPAAFVQECRRLLLDAAAAGRDGRRLHEVNAARWTARLPHEAVAALLRRQPAAP